MNRRDFLVARLDSREPDSQVETAPTPARAPRTRDSSNASLLSVSLAPYAGAWGPPEAAHLLRRTVFGFTRADLSRVAGMTLRDAVTMLLTPTQTPAAPVAVQSGSEVQWVNGGATGNSDTLYMNYLLAWWVDLSLLPTLSITENMTLFWHNHFATGSLAVKDARYMYKQNALLRQSSLGNVKDLIRSVTLDPAMLRYLNGSTNVKGSPNENYARELQELFTIGKGPERAPGDYTNYTEADIKQAARILTGWADDVSTQVVKFTASKHDAGNKTFSAAYGNRVIRGGATESEARRELDELLDMILAQPATSRYICRKIYRWFVDYMIDDLVESNIIGPMADLLVQSKYEIRPVMEALLLSEHFNSLEMRGSVIKNPASLMLGTMRTFPWLDDEYNPTPFADTVQFRMFAFRTVRRMLGTMGMDFMNPPNVAGWPAYYQEPTFHEGWINADTLQKRINFLNDVASDGWKLDEAYYPSLIDVIGFVKTLSDPSNANALIDDATQLLLPVRLSSAQRDAINDILLPGLPDYEWTVEWNAFTADETNSSKRTVIETKLRALFKHILAMAEYQLS
ncbi:MAG: DUF1800 domain-containing protein [bacterium]|nr:DUF1800 domain-containing protein [Candidatus Kapabacteria bacterium]